MLVRTIALVVLAMLSGLTAPAQQSTRQTSALSFGNPRADYRIEVFYDLQCGSCVSFHEGLKKVEDRFPNKVYITIRHFPLPLHDQAFMASTVVEAASRQGKGLEMVDALLNDQGRWSTAKKPFSVVFEYVKQLGLDEKKFRADLQTDGVALSVLLDLHRGKGLGVNSTPTTFLNGKQLSFIEALELEEIISKGSN